MPFRNGQYISQYRTEQYDRDNPSNQNNQNGINNSQSINSVNNSASNNNALPSGVVQNDSTVTGDSTNYPYARNRMAIPTTPSVPNATPSTPQSPKSLTDFAVQSAKAFGTAAYSTALGSLGGGLFIDMTKDSLRKRIMFDIPNEVAREYTEKYGQEGWTKPVSQAVEMGGFAVGTALPMAVGGIGGKLIGSALKIGTKELSASEIASDVGQKISEKLFTPTNIGQVVGGTVGTGVAVRQQKLNEFHEIANQDNIQKTGEPITSDQWNQIIDEANLRSAANREAFWTAMPMVVGGVLGQDIIAGKTGTFLADTIRKYNPKIADQLIGLNEKPILRTIGKFAGITAEQQALMTFQGYEVGKINAELGLQEDPTILGTLREQFIPVTLLSAGLPAIMGSMNKGRSLILQHQVKANFPDNSLTTRAQINSLFNIFNNSKDQMKSTLSEKGIPDAEIDAQVQKQGNDYAVDTSWVDRIITAFGKVPGVKSQLEDMYKDFNVLKTAPRVWDQNTKSMELDYNNATPEQISANANMYARQILTVTIPETVNKRATEVLERAYPTDSHEGVNNPNPLYVPGLYGAVRNLAEKLNKQDEGKIVAKTAYSDLLNTIEAIRPKTEQEKNTYRAPNDQNVGEIPFYSEENINQPASSKIKKHVTPTPEEIESEFYQKGYAGESNLPGIAPAEQSANVFRDAEREQHELNQTSESMEELKHRLLMEEVESKPLIAIKGKEKQVATENAPASTIPATSIMDEARARTVINREEGGNVQNLFKQETDEEYQARKDAEWNARQERLNNLTPEEKDRLARMEATRKSIFSGKITKADKLQDKIDKLEERINNTENEALIDKLEAQRDKLQDELDGSDAENPQSPQMLAKSTRSEFNPDEISIANKTSRGAYFSKSAIVPKIVAERANPDDTILDFGAGKSAVHANDLREKGFNVTAHEFGDNVVDGVHDPNALNKQYDKVYASNVLNVQSSEDMLRRTLSEVAPTVKSDTGEFIANYPKDPRKSEMNPDNVQSILSEYFNKVERIGGSNSAPVFSASEPKSDAQFMAKGAQSPDWYYSQLSRTLEDKLPNKGVGQSYKSTIESWAKKGEFKADELEASGLLSDPDSPLNRKGAVSKQEVLDWLDENNVRVEEKILGESFVDKLNKDSEINVHSLTLTPSMRESALKGQPLFLGTQGERAERIPVNTQRPQSGIPSLFPERKIPPSNPELEALDYISEKSGVSLADIHIVEPPTTHTAAAMSMEIARVFGHEKDIVFFEAPGNDIVDGVNYDGRIFVDINSNNPQTFVVSHEITHSLQRRYPELYRPLFNVINMDERAFQTFKSSLSKETLKLYKNDTVLRDEFVANTVAERMHDSGFWWNMYKGAPDTVRKIMNMISTILSKLRLKSDFLTSTYFKDLKSVQKVIDDTMTQYAKHEYELGAGRKPVSAEVQRVLDKLQPYMEAKNKKDMSTVSEPVSDNDINFLSTSQSPSERIQSLDELRSKTDAPTYIKLLTSPQFMAKGESDPVIKGQIDSIKDAQEVFGPKHGIFDKALELFNDIWTGGRMSDSERAKAKSMGVEVVEPAEHKRVRLAENFASSPEFYMSKDKRTNEVFRAASYEEEERRNIRSRIIEANYDAKTDRLTDNDKLRKKFPQQFNLATDLFLNRDIDNNPIYARELWYEKMDLDKELSSDNVDSHRIIAINLRKNEIDKEIDSQMTKNLVDAGLDENSIKMFKNWRYIYDNELKERILLGAKLVGDAERKGIELPKKSMPWHGKFQEVTMRDLLNEMGSLVGSYFPRMRDWQPYNVVSEHTKLEQVKDKNDKLIFDPMGKPIMREVNMLKPMFEYVRNQHEGFMLSERRKREGYTKIVVSKSKEKQSGLMGKIGSMEAMESLIQNAIKHMNVKSEEFKSLESVPDITVNHNFPYTRKDNVTENHLTIDDPNNKYRKALMDAGGNHFTNGDGLWHFINPDESTTQTILDSINSIHGIESEKVIYDLLDSLFDEMTTILRSDTFRSSMIQRGGGTGIDVWGGYSTDIQKVTNASVNMTSGGIAKSNFAAKSLSALAGTSNLDINDYTKGFTVESVEAPNKKTRYRYVDMQGNKSTSTYNSETSALRAGEVSGKRRYFERVKANRIDPELEPVLHERTVKYIQHILSSRMEVNKAFTIIKQLAAIKYLGLSPMSAIVNTTSMITAAPPVISNATGMSLADVFTYQYRALTSWIDYKKNPESFHSTNYEMGQLFEQMQRGDWEMSQQNEAAMSGVQANSPELWSRIIRVMLIPMRETEKVNRIAAIGASFKYLSEKAKLDHANLDENGHLKAEIIKSFADQSHEISEDVNGTYGKTSTPYWAQGTGVIPNLAQLGLLFMKFPQTYVLNMKDMGYKYHNYKALAYMAVAPMILAGAAANPAYSLGKSVIDKILSIITGSDNPSRDFYDWVGKTFGEFPQKVAEEGMFGALTPFSIKNSLSIQFPTLTNSIPTSMYNDATRGLSSIWSGDVYKGVESIAPRFVQSPMRSYREMHEGVSTTSNEPVFLGNKRVKRTTGEFIEGALGMGNVNIAKEKQEVQEDRQLQKLYQDRRKEINDRYRAYYLQPTSDRNPKDLINLRKKVQAYNMRIKEKKLIGLNPITSDDLERLRTSGLKPTKFQQLREKRLRAQGITQAEYM